MKVNSRVYKGIEYVQLSDLPREQQLLIVESLNEDSFIKILIEKNVLSECIQYKEYDLWFENVFRGTVISAPRKKPSLTSALVDYTLGKA